MNPLPQPNRGHVKLSILMPSHRTDRVAIARIAQACSWAASDVEVIVRDNSGDLAKRGLIAPFAHDNCRILTVDECDAWTNFLALLEAARGDYVFFVADDDLVFDRGIAAVADLIRADGGAADVVGVTGAYVVEVPQGSVTLSYERIGAAEMAERVAGYVGLQGPNMLFYSAIRRETTIDAWQIARSHPIAPPYQDQLLALLYVMSGRFLSIGRFLVSYDNMNWETAETAAASDERFYRAAGLDPAYARLHWLACAAEGAWLALHAQPGAGHSPTMRNAAAKSWFECMYRRFVGDQRVVQSAAFDAEAAALCQKWRQPRANFGLPEILEDLGGFMALTSPETAAAYRRFWQVFVEPTPAG